MSKSGQLNIGGISAQCWAALSLFLQYIREQNFRKIHLESRKGEDFEIIFADGKKIFCESKAWKKAFTYSNLRDVLDKINTKKSVDYNDEILIICTKLSEKLRMDVANYKDWKDYYIDKFRSKKFSQDIITLIPRVKFWTVTEIENKNLVNSLFRELVEIWLPQPEIESRIHSIFVENILDKSKKGLTFEKQEIINEISQIKSEVITRSGHFDKRRCEIVKQFDQILEALKNNRSPIWAPGHLSAISAQPELTYFLFDEFKKSTIDRLEDWQDLWQLCNTYYFSINLLSIFKNNLHTQCNRSYIMKFFTEQFLFERKYYRNDFLTYPGIQIVNKIIEMDNSHYVSSFIFARKLIDSQQNKFLFLNKGWGDEREIRNICGLIKRIYDNADNSLRKEIVEYIFLKFNLIEEDSDEIHSNYENIINIISDWFKKDVSNNFSYLVKYLATQYDMYYKQISNNLPFKGYEYVGGCSVFCGNNYHVSDKRFVNVVLQQGILHYYHNDSKLGWEFVKNHCIIPDNQISKDKPDFLNRAAIPVIIERFKNTNSAISNEAFTYLIDFIFSKKGIPNKSDLIFQFISKDDDFPLQKKWQLAKETLIKFNTPLNVFIEDITLKAALNGIQEAKDIIKRWFSLNEYLERHRVFSRLQEIIIGFLDVDLDFSIVLFSSYLDSDAFKDKSDIIDPVKTANLFFEILKRDFIVGKNIWNNVAYQNSLTKQQQLFISYSITSIKQNDGKNNIDKTLLLEISEDIVFPFLNRFNRKIDKIYSKLPFSSCREEFVRFAEILARNKFIEQALEITEIFINDPSPFLPDNDPDDLDNKFNEHYKILSGEEPITIHTVRGWCCWVLKTCAVLEGRVYIERIIDVTEKLAHDTNWYIKHMVCFTVSHLSEIRLKVLPDNSEVLFFNDDREVALKMSKRVEDIAFKILIDLSKAPKPVQTALINSIFAVFSFIRALNEKDAMTLLSVFRKFPPETLSKTAFLFIYFAEYRKNDYINYKYCMPGLYDDLSPDKFDDSKFKKLLYETIDVIEPKYRSSFAFQCLKMTGNIIPDTKDRKRIYHIAYKYLDYLYSEYHQDLFKNIYIFIKDGQKKGYDKTKLYNLYIKCLDVEKQYYLKHLTPDNLRDMYWWPAYENDDILEWIYQNMSEDNFLHALNIILDFPNELNLYISKSISLLDNFKKSDKRIMPIDDKLFDRSPSRYYYRKKKWSR
ncbi:hypothetical protein ACFL6I_22110 [candidate division KSB1 bacterium]